ncbi:alpha/beta hydrolase, partial [Dokdonella sp.]|uniref:alpha/beta hydrolase n=1 Tax=Dokdonella sp. TaxID=2291710 RepID=UPI00261D0985
MDKRNAVRLAIAVAFLAVVGVREWTKPRAQRDGPDSEQGAAIAQKNGERGFSLGSLRFEPCELGQRNSAATTAAFCAPFEVPENWDKPDGRRIGLRLAMIRSDSEAPARDLVVLLAGGPGQAATEVYPRAAGAFAPLLRKRNVVLMDQRGTGGSHALECAPDLSGDEAEAAGALDLAKLRANTRACLDSVAKNADPAQYTTTAAVRDLEALRQALGAPQFDLVGVSYGTRVALQYLRRHPDGVRSIVLDSPLPNEVVLGAEFARNLDDSLKAQFAACSKDTECGKAFGDPYANLYRLRDRLAAEPQQVTLHAPRTHALETKTLGALRLAGLARLFAYAPETSALLPLAVDRALKGDYAPLTGQSEYIASETSDLVGSGMQLSVVCAEDADLLGGHAGDEHLLLGDAFVPLLREQCVIWPRGTRPADFHEPVRSDKPVLILSGEFDPVTPPRYGEAILKGLPNGRQLVAAGQGHSVMGRGCLPKLAARFVDTLETKALDAGCIADFGK